MMYDANMRTTLTLDPDVARRIQEELALGQLTLKSVINAALKRGLGLEKPAPAKPFRVTPHASDFVPGTDVGKLNMLVDELEGASFVSRARRKR